MALLSARLNIGRLNAERLNWIGADVTPPTVPQSLTATATSPTTILVSWQASTDFYGVAQYRLYRCTGATCTPVAVRAYVRGAITYTDHADPLTTYRYQVRAEDASGNLSGPSNIATATTPDRALLTQIRIKVGGVFTDVSQYARVAAATVTQALNEVADTASITFDGKIPYPIKGIEIQFMDGAGVLHFAGMITAVRTVYEGRARNVAYQCDCLDYTWLLNSRKVTVRHWSSLASAIISELVRLFAPAGFTVDLSGVSTNPILDEITFTNEELAQAISRTCERAGLYWYVDYGAVVHVFNSFAVPSAGTIDDTHPRTAVKLAKHEDYVPIATQIIGRGGGSTASIDLPVGSTTLPIEDPVWYTTGGGLFVECGPQRIAYTGVSNPGTGAIVGMGNAPTSAPIVTAAAGSNLAAGAAYKYAVTFVTSAGETLAGATVDYRPTGATIAPPPAPTVEIDYYSGSKLVIGGSYRWALEWKIQGGGRVGGAPSAALTIPAGGDGRPKWVRVSWGSAIFNGVDPSVIGLYVHRTTNNGGTFYYDLHESGRNQGYVTSSDLLDSDLVQMGQMSGGGAGLLSAALSQIPTRVGATARKVYRTAANGSQLKLVATIADNTTTTFLDTVADGALGVNAPATDTSGIQSGGQVNAGSPSILVSTVGPFLPSGGWVRVSGLTLQYTSVSGSSLVLAAPLPSTLSYGSEILNAPYLSGIPPSGTGSILYAIKGGDEVYILVIRNDAAAIAALAAATGGDGIREEFLTDGRLALAELTARADATLAMRKQALVTVNFESRDPLVTVGKTITFNTTQPPIVGTFLIQRVTISQFQARGSIGHPDPLRVVEASSRRYTFDDLVQQIKLLGRIN